MIWEKYSKARNTFFGTGSSNYSVNCNPQTLLEAFQKALALDLLLMAPWWHQL
jgi:hypothetical protein